MDVRRVVTGHDSQGKSVFASDVTVAPLTLAFAPGAEFHRLWGGDDAPTFPDDGSPSEQPMYFPPVGGFRFGMFSIAPAGTAAGEPQELATILAEVDEKLPGLMTHMETNDPGMHTTDTIDFEVVLDGECELELDDGAFVTLRRGDTVVQNGTRHRWRNSSDTTCRLAVFIVGAHRK
jgi:hypothetical protein